MRIAGIGFRAGASAESIRNALGGAEVDALATLDRKVEALRKLELGLPVIGVSQDAISATRTPTYSAKVMAEVGTGSLAEAAALVAAGPRGRLIVIRRKSSDGMATAAIAEGQNL